MSHKVTFVKQPGGVAVILNQWCVAAITITGSSWWFRYKQEGLSAAKLKLIYRETHRYARAQNIAARLNP